MSARPNLLTIIQRAADKALRRAEGGHAPCLADRLALDLAGMSAREIEQTPHGAGTVTIPKRGCGMTPANSTVA